MAVCQNLVPLVNIKIAGKWMFIPLKMVLIGIDPYPYIYNWNQWTLQWSQVSSHVICQAKFLAMKSPRICRLAAADKTSSGLQGGSIRAMLFFCMIASMSRSIHPQKCKDAGKLWRPQEVRREENPNLFLRRFRSRLLTFHSTFAAWFARNIIYRA